MRKSLASLAVNLPPFRGKGRIFRPMIKALGGGQEFLVERSGVIFEVRGLDVIDYYIMTQKLESPELTEFLVSFIGESDWSFWDIGANVGGVTLPVLHQCPNVSVVSFEPSPSVCGRLMRNLSHNPRLQARCQVIGLPLSDRTGWTRFFTTSNPDNSGVGGLGESFTREAVGFSVETKRADVVAERVGRPMVVKMDVEGYEAEVLEGFGDLLDGDLCIVFEHNLYRFEERGLPADQVCTLLRNRGFSLFTLSGGEIDLGQDNDFVAVKGQAMLDRLPFKMSAVHAHS